LITSSLIGHVAGGEETMSEPPGLLRPLGRDTDAVLAAVGA
jgi:hypothetical protein